MSPMDEDLLAEAVMADIRQLSARAQSEPIFCSWRPAALPAAVGDHATPCWFPQARECWRTCTVPDGARSRTSASSGTPSPAWSRVRARRPPIPALPFECLRVHFFFFFFALEFKDHSLPACGCSQPKG